MTMASEKLRRIVNVAGAFVAAGRSGQSPEDRAFCEVCHAISYLGRLAFEYVDALAANIDASDADPEHRPETDARYVRALRAFVLATLDDGLRDRPWVKELERAAP